MRHRSYLFLLVMLFALALTPLAEVRAADCEALGTFCQCCSCECPPFVPKPCMAYCTLNYDCLGEKYCWQFEMGCSTSGGGCYQWRPIDPYEKKGQRLAARHIPNAPAITEVSRRNRLVKAGQS